MSKEDELDKNPRNVDEIEKELEDIKEELEIIEKEYGEESKIQEEDVFQDKVDKVKEDFTLLQKSSKEIQEITNKSQVQDPKKENDNKPQEVSKKSKGKQNNKKENGLSSRKFSLDSEEIDSDKKPKPEKIMQERSAEIKDTPKEGKYKKRKTKKPTEKKGSTKKKQPKKKKRSISGRTKFSSKLKIGIVKFPGTNNEYETVRALKSFGVEVEIVDSFELKRVTNLDGLWIAGGLSGDHRGDAIASVSALMKEIIKEDKPILGVSDGFQILTKSNLLPGSLIQNNSTKFICDWVYLTIPENNSYLSDLTGSKVRLPIAHLKGNLQATKLEEVKSNAVALYSNYKGSVQERYNPNGSLGNIAGLGTKSIVALMPHPERASFKFQGSTDGRRIIEAFLHEVKR